MSGVTGVHGASADWRVVDTINEVGYHVSQAALTAIKMVGDAFYNVYDFVYAKNPMTDKREFWLVPSWFENSLGKSHYNNLIREQGGRSVDRRDQEMLQRIGQRLAEHAPRQGLEFEFTVIDSDVVNAWCMPGGKVGFHSGILNRLRTFADTSDYEYEDLVAAVMGHEIAHACGRHSAKQIEGNILWWTAGFLAQVALRVFGKEPQTEQERQQRRNAENALSLGSMIVGKLSGLHHSRQHELEADEYGIYMMESAGFDPRAAIGLQEFFLRISGGDDRSFRNILSTHPASADRLEANERTVARVLQQRV